MKNFAPDCILLFCNRIHFVQMVAENEQEKLLAILDIALAKMII